MRIDPEVCIGCEECLVYCPVGAIHMGDGVAETGGENVKPKEDEEDGARTLYLFER